VSRVNTTALLQFLAVDLLLVLTPGADWAYIVRATLGRESPAAAIGGIVSGYVLHALLVTLGVAALLARAPDARAALTVAGALYLVWLGAGALREPVALGADTAARQRRADSVAVRGLLVSGLNPKGLLLFFAVLPQFVRPAAAWPVSLQLGVLGALHLLACTAVYRGVAAGARSLLTRRRAAAALGTVSGALMAVIGVALTVEQALRL
jgi:threonine/homoserine/homoserine lactone efflux protein